MEQDNSSSSLSAKEICYNQRCHEPVGWEIRVTSKLPIVSAHFFVACQLLLYVIAVVDF